jgi:hypothetical protein
MAESTPKTDSPRKATGARKGTSTRKAPSGAKGSARDNKPDNQADSGADRGSDGGTDGKARAQRGWQVALEAARQLQQLTGSEVEGVTGLRRTDDGWRVQVDVLELHRVPSTTDVIASYDVDVDPEGDLVGYHRQHRFVRGEVNDAR